MSDLLRFYRVRPPQKAAVRQVLSRGISTHQTTGPNVVTSAGPRAPRQPFLLHLAAPEVELELSTGADQSKGAAVTTSFHDRLHAAYQAQDVDRFIRVASDFYQNEAVRDASNLQRISQEAYSLFERMGSIPQRAAVQHFLERYSGGALENYVQRESQLELRRVGDTILALEALRMHGAQTGLAHTLLLKSLHGVRLAHALHARDRKGWSVAPLRRLLDLQVFVPGWVWMLDPCGVPIRVGQADIGDVAQRAKAAGGAPAGRTADPPDSPLARQAKAVSEYREASRREPGDGSCECVCDERCVPQNPCCAKNKSFVTDLLVVRQKLHCYEPYEIAYVENVLAGEKRSRKHETFLQVEQKEETERTARTSEERDHQISERFELSSETQKTVEQDLSIETGVTYNQKWGAGAASGSVTANLNASYGLSKSTSEQEARNYAREVIDRSVSKIERSVREFVSRRVLSETRETNEHIFDRTGQDLTVGIYHWVNKITKAQVYGYGRRMMYELIPPEPALHYKVLLARAYGLDEEFSQSPPQEPDVTPKQITAENYIQLLGAYGITEGPKPPQMNKVLTQTFHGDYGDPKHGSGQQTQSMAFDVPEDYVATSMWGNVDPSWNDNDPSNLVIQTGDTWIVWHKDGTDSTSASLPNLEGHQQGFVQAFNVTWFNATFSVGCTIKPEVLQNWQLAVYNLIAEAYEKQLKAYEEAKAEFDAKQAAKEKAMRDAIRNRNPFFNREIERTELKRLALSMLSCQHFDQFNAMKRRVQPCGLPQPALREAEEEGRIIRFWEQAIDWNLMTYLFYPYFWSPKCSWEEKIVEDTGDGLFDKFMSAGAARVQIPVREGFEAVVLYWENTGQIWGQEGDPPVSSSDAHWLSMVEEIKHQQDCFQNDREGTVETSPPSDLITIKGSDRYWDPVLASVDPGAVAKDLNREIVIDAVVYRITDIDLAAGSPPFDPLQPDSMWWSVRLDRPYAGAAAAGLPYAVGAAFVGAPWFVTVPTNLVWLKNEDNCLPCYPLPACEE